MKAEELKGYPTSTDYESLWDLINNGYRVPCWLKNRSMKTVDIAEVKMTIFDIYTIGSRGMGYDSHSMEKEDFIADCKSVELKYVIPTKHIIKENARLKAELISWNELALRNEPFSADTDGLRERIDELNQHP